MFSLYINYSAFYLVYVLSLTIIVVQSYNVEVEKVGIGRGENGSQFGYSVAMVKEPGWTQKGNRDKSFINKLLLVGAPNETFNGIHGHGQVYKCDEFNTSTINCVSQEYTEEIKLCDSIAKDPKHSNCAENSRLGMTIAVNKNYDKSMEDNYRTPMVTVCAPTWKNVVDELNTFKGSHKYMTGMCLKLREDLSTILCDVFNKKRLKHLQYCWPFWVPGGLGNVEKNYYHYSEGGMAADFTEDGYEVITAPGFADWKGGYSYNTKTFEGNSNKNTYFGYAISIGKFRDADTVFGVPNWYNESRGYFGKAALYNDGIYKSDINFGIQTGVNVNSCFSVNIDDYIDISQTGTKFGSSLASIDITGDGYDEIFVGSPLYSGDRPDEGRVFVYSVHKHGRVCGPIGILSGSARYAVFNEKAVFARFGSSIASVGDLDMDGYKDVAVGAPYEDDGTGAVYIYHGIGNCNCSMEDKFAQRIAGSHVFPGIKSFGWSIYGEEDVDDNTYPDFVVGAYQSDMVALFRTRPIVELSVKLFVSPKVIPMNGSELLCSRDNQSLCFNVSVSFQYKSRIQGTGRVNKIEIAWTLRADTTFKSKKRFSRLEFRANGTDTITQQITLFRNDDDIKTKHYTIDVKGHNGRPEPYDTWTPVTLEGSYELVRFRKDFNKLDPVLPDQTDTEVSETAYFEEDFIDLDMSDLAIKAEMFLIRNGRNLAVIKVNDNTTIYIDNAHELEVTVIVENLANIAHRVSFDGFVSALLHRGVRQNEGIVDASCNTKSPLTKSETTMNCSAYSKLNTHENLKVKFYFDISRERLIPHLNLDNMLDFIQIRYKAQQINNDTNLDNNEFQFDIPVAFKHDVYIEEDKETSDQKSYKAYLTSTRNIRLTHKYYIVNKGPSYLPVTFVNISIPITYGGFTVAAILHNKLPKICQIHEQEAIRGTTTTSIPTATSGFTAKQSDGDPNDTPSTYDQAKWNMSCSEGSDDCVIIECKITNLEKDNPEVIEINIEVFEKELAKQKGAREIGYVTHAVVTDPYIWYGRKVMQWRETVYAEKMTLFIVETHTVKLEVSIWIIIGAVAGGVNFLVINIIILWKCGFFQRKQQDQIQKWKRENLYNDRKSVRMSRLVNPTDNDGDGAKKE